VFIKHTLNPQKKKKKPLAKTLPTKYDLINL
jgi:hypothetical protein